MQRGNKPKRKAAIVCSKNSFFISGLKSKLDEIGIEGVTVPTDIDAINVSIGRTDPIVYYMADEVFKHDSEDFLGGLRNMCLDFKKMLILIGDAPEYQMAIKFIPKTAIVKWFKRPVDIEGLLDTLKECYSGKVKVSGKKHILIVDDDTTFMRMMHESLKDFYRVNMLTSGSQALLWLKDNRPDLILLDYEMPGENGVDVYNMIKDNRDFRDIPIIFLTGRQDREAVLSAIDLSPEDYILKSVDQQHLIERLEDVFEREVNKPGYVPPSELMPSKDESMSEIDRLMAEMNML